MHGLGIFGHLTGMLAHAGPSTYGIVFGIALLESVLLLGLFVPADTTLILTGILVSQRVLPLSLPLLMALSALGAVIGSTLSYAAGRFSSIALAKDLFGPRSHILLERGEAFFARYGRVSVFAGRFWNLFRPVVPFVAGASRMPWRPFLLWNTLGSIGWGMLFLSLGYFGGSALRRTIIFFSQGGGTFGFALFILIVIAAFGLHRGIRRT